MNKLNVECKCNDKNLRPVMSAMEIVSAQMDMMWDSMRKSGVSKDFVKGFDEKAEKFALEDALADYQRKEN